SMKHYTSAQPLKVAPKALDETRIISTDPRHLSHLAPQRNISLAMRGRTASSDDPPHVAVIKTILNPVMVVLTLHVCILLYGELLSGYYLVLTVLAFFI